MKKLSSYFLAKTPILFLYSTPNLVGCKSQVIGAGSVSYTHLDVYKRQPLIYIIE